MTLIHHGIVYFNEGTDDKKEATFYEIDTNKVLMRLRMARIMRVTEEHYGKSVSVATPLSNTLSEI